MHRNFRKVSYFKLSTTPIFGHRIEIDVCLFVKINLHSFIIIATLISKLQYHFLRNHGLYSHKHDAVS